jgi:AcrR family transcriptional regulator
MLKLGAAVTGDIRDGSAGLDLEAQRERLINAFTKIASERGYVKTTVRDVVVAAGLPQAAFYEHFSSKKQCLTAAYDAFLERMVEEAQQAADDGEEWPLRVKEAIAAGLSFVAETATRARFFAVEAPAAGPIIFERYIAGMSRIVFLLRSGREHYPNAAELPELTEQVLVGGAACLVSSALLSEEHTRLPSLEVELVEIMLTPYLGREEAKRIAASPLPQRG